MKKTILAVILFSLLGFAASADRLRVGLIGTVELDEKPDCETVVERFHAGENVLNGLYWEVIADHVGSGMTCSLDFDRHLSPIPEVDHQWTMDWVATWDDSTSTVKGHLRLVEVGSPANYAVYTISAVTDNTDWLELTVAAVDSNGSLADTDSVRLGFTRTGDKGDTGATGATGPTGPTGPVGIGLALALGG